MEEEERRGLPESVTYEEEGEQEEKRTEEKTDALVISVFGDISTSCYFHLYLV